MKTIRYQFLDRIPESSDMEEGVLYISIPLAIANHKCACGCGHEVVTNLSPTDWKLTFDGETVSLYPSIGNWNFPCRSHYWIRNNKIKEAEAWSDYQKVEGERKNIKETKKKKRRGVSRFFRKRK